MIILQLSPKYIKYLCDIEFPPKAHAKAMNLLNFSMWTGTMFKHVVYASVPRNFWSFYIIVFATIIFQFVIIDVINEFRSEFSELIHVREDKATFSKVVHFCSISYERFSISGLPPQFIKHSFLPF